MAGAGEKKARARRFEAVRFWGAVCAVLFAAAAATLVWRALPGAVSRAVAAALIAQAAIYALCVWRIGVAAAGADDAHGAALGAGSGGDSANGGVWKDLVYVNAIFSLAAAFAPMGGWATALWFAWALCVTAFAAWHAVAAFKGMTAAVRAAAGVPSAAAGGDGAADGGDAPAGAARSAKRARQESEAEKRRKGR
jgi:hypothetical protein